MFDPQGVCGVYWQLFAKIVFPPLLAAILNFCVKRKNVFISETERDRAISKKFLTHRESGVYWRLFAKIVFPPLLAAILNFCIKHKSVFFSETERDRAISMNFFYPQSLLAIFPKNRFPVTFGGHFEFLRKTQKK